MDCWVLDVSEANWIKTGGRSSIGNSEHTLPVKNSDGMPSPLGRAKQEVNMEGRNRMASYSLWCIQRAHSGWSQQPPCAGAATHYSIAASSRSDCSAGGSSCESKTTIFRSQKTLSLSAIKWWLSVGRFGWGFPLRSPGALSGQAGQKKRGAR
jgi:hypothetical protein